MEIHLKKPTGKQVKRFLIHTLIILAGNALASAASAFFIIPNGLTMGGTTGLGIFIGNFWDNEFAVSLVVYIVNAVLFVVGSILLGKRFAVATLAGTVFYPSFLSLWTYLNRLYVEHNGAPIAHESPLLACIMGALIFGFGIGIVVRIGASTGGTDIPALIFHKFFNMPVSVGMWSCDIVIIAVQFSVSSVETVLYGIVISLLSSFVINRVSPIGMKRTQVLIISGKYKEIREAILNKLNRGVTMFHARTGFLQENTMVLLTIVSSRDVVKLRNEVQAIDPNAFLMISEVSEVAGRGFSLEKIPLPLSEEKDIQS